MRLKTQPRQTANVGRNCATRRETASGRRLQGIAPRMPRRAARSPRTGRFDAENSNSDIFWRWDCPTGGSFAFAYRFRLSLSMTERRKKI